MKIKKFLFTTIILTVVFTGLTLLANLIETNNIKNNVVKSMEEYDFLDNEFYDIKIDNYTDMIMLNIMTYEDNNRFLEKAFLQKYGYEKDQLSKQMNWNQYTNLKSVLDNNYEGSGDYGRHWNGWQIILKPLLSVFTYQTILNIFLILQIIIIILISYFIIKKFNLLFLITFLVSLISLSAYEFSSCLQFTMIGLPTLIACLIVILKGNDNKFNSQLFFYILGSIITFLNFLNFTLISLTLPLMILLAHKFYNGEYLNYKENIIYVIKNSICWLLGYGILWICKWVIGYIFLGGTFIKDALISANQRLGLISTFNYIDVLYLNINEFFHHKSSIFILIWIIIFSIILFRKNFINKIKISIPFLLIGLYPFIWYLVLQNHSAIHYWMTYRLFGISVMCMLFIITFLIKNNLDNIKVEKFNINDYYFFIIIILFIILYKLPIIYLIFLIITLLLKNINKNIKFCCTILIIFSIFMISFEFIGKRYFSNEIQFKNIYNEIYSHALRYGYQYVTDNQTENGVKINFKDLVNEYDSDSVFLLQCKGYIVVDRTAVYNVVPYINCKDTMVTNGYTE